MGESSKLDKAEGLERQKNVSFGFEKERKQLRAKSLGLDKVRGLKRKKSNKSKL